MAFGSLAEAFVDIGINLNPLRAGLAQAKGMLGSATKGMGSIMSSGLLGLGLGAGIAATLGLAIKGAMDAEQAEEGLAAALFSTGQEVDANISKMKAFAESVQSVTTVEDDALIATMKTGVQMGLTAEQAQQAAQAAVGLAKSTKMDLGSAMEAVSREMQGVPSRLSKSIPALDGVTDATQRLAIINEQASEGMGQAFQETNTAKGSFAQLKNTVAALMDSLGGLVAGPLTNLFTWLNNLIEVTTEYTKTADGGFGAVSSAASTMGSIFSTVFSVIKTIIEGTIFTIANLGNYGTILGGLFMAGMGTVVDAASWAFTNVVNLATWLWDNMGTLFQDGCNYALTVFSNLGENIKTFFTGLWDWIKSGGSKGFEEGFKGITEGFVAKTKAYSGYKKWEEGALHKAGDDVAKQGFDTIEANRKKWEEAAAKVRQQQEDAKRGLAETNLTLTEAGKNRDEKEKKKKGDSKDKGGEWVGLADAWKQMQSAALKKKDDIPDKQLKESIKQTAELKNLGNLFAGAFALNV